MRWSRSRRAVAGTALLLPAGIASALPTALSVSAEPATEAAAQPAARDLAVGGSALASHDIVVSDRANPLPAVSAAGFVVVDLDSGKVLAAKDPHGTYAPASTLKMLTAVTLLPRLSPADQVTPSRAAVDVDGTKVGLVTSMAYPVSELFAALLIASANDAAAALADAAGGMPATVDLVNAEAAHLQARDTRAVNDSGLDAPGQVSSAYDLALIARAGLARPDFRAYVATAISSVAAPNGKRIEIDNHNRLLRSYPGTIGVKNGYTDQARASYVGAATRDGHLMLVALVRSEPTIWQDAAALLDWGFAAKAAGVPAVGKLVEPGSAEVVAAAAILNVTRAPAVVGGTAARGRAAPGRPLRRLTLLALVLTLLAVLLQRRRQVRRLRARRLRP